MYRQWDNEMMRMANGEIDNASGSASCTSIKNSSEDLELYFIAVSLTLHCLVLVFINYYLYYPCRLPRFKYRPISGYQNSYLALSLVGIKSNKIPWGSEMNKTFYFFYSPKLQNQPWKSICLNWSTVKTRISALLQTSAPFEVKLKLFDWKLIKRHLHTSASHKCPYPPQGRKKSLNIRYGSRIREFQY